MISILIPFYNFDSRALVQELHRQGMAAASPFEIICLDDASDESFRILNREISTLENVIYVESPENLGRSAVRNRLAEKARYDYFLYMDCDGMPVHANYVSEYLSRLEGDKVIYGGRKYLPEKPADISVLFHWTYGTQREAVPARVRMKKPYERFMTNNFVIPRKVYFAHPMNENLSGYGHEDTLFAMELESSATDIIHIENPMYHIGLEDGLVFLQKQENAIRNLVYIIRNHPLAARVKLYRFYLRLKAAGVMKVLYPRLKRKEKQYRNNLLGPDPSIRSLDWLKLIWLHEALR